jgi:hypothetical protein
MFDSAGNNVLYKAVKTIKMYTVGYVSMEANYLTVNAKLS